MAKKNKSVANTATISRRTFLKGAEALGLAATGCVHRSPTRTGTLVNDVQSRLNATQVDCVVSPRSLLEIQSLVKQTGDQGKSLVCLWRAARHGGPTVSLG